MQFFGKLCSAFCGSAGNETGKNDKTRASQKSFSVLQSDTKNMTPQTSKNKRVSNSNISIDSLRSGVSQKSDPHNITVNMGTSDQILPPLAYSEEDIQDFRSYVE